VSLLEANEEFVQKAVLEIPSNQLSKTFVTRFGDWKFIEGSEKYDLVWIQWVIIYASDDELVSFLKEAVKSLKPETGMIGLKDNMLSDQSKPLFDNIDHSVCRSCAHLEALFVKAELRVVEKKLQQGFPRDLFPVWMYMLEPSG